MIIKNRRELETTEGRKVVLDIIEAGIERVLPETVMGAAVMYDAGSDTLTVQGDTFSLSGGRLFVIGGGKASGLMAAKLESIIPPDRITAGVVTCKHGSGPHGTRKIDIIEAGHPVPDEQGIRGVRQMLELKSRYGISEGDLVLCLISGGGSALMPCPVEGVSLEDKQRVTGQLLACGADIHEINRVRKHLSMVKGGRLGEHFAPARVVSLILSDVIGNNLDVIASGPTSPDSSTFGEARWVLEKYRLREECPVSVTAYLDRGCRGEVPDTPKSVDTCRNYIIGDIRMALEAMAEKAAACGLTPVIATTGQQGETGEAARTRAKEILYKQYMEYNVIILGGETTPVLPENHGEGGRNQHYAAVTVQSMGPYFGAWTFASVGTDGSDYLAEAAGAIVDNRTGDQIREKGMDIGSYIRRHDSYGLFRKIGGALIETGSTGTNVGDVMVYLVE
jgi:hydroxypyruvate reductase/glycerate 2-kinase